MIWPRPRQRSSDNPVPRYLPECPEPQIKYRSPLVAAIAARPIAVYLCVDPKTCSAVRRHALQLGDTRYNFLSRDDALDPALCRASPDRGTRYNLGTRATTFSPETMP